MDSLTRAGGQIKSSFIREIVWVKGINLWSIHNWQPARGPFISRGGLLLHPATSPYNTIMD